WTYVRDQRPWAGAAPPGTVYYFAPDWKEEHVHHHLRQTSGILQADGYKGYGKLYEPGADGTGRFREAACWAHWRRDFHDIWTSNKSEIAREVLDRIGALYDIERDIAGQPVDIRLAARQKHSTAKVEALRVWAEAQLTRIPGKGDLASAFRYGLSRWHSFCLFLEDGRVAMDNNAAERALRPIGGPESLCTPCLSVCKHWKRLRVSGATRATLSGYRGLNRRRSKVAGADLIRRAGNHLLGRQGSVPAGGGMTL
ncbi:IS66 family transposase, partial [Sinorhizobium meliloti]